MRTELQKRKEQNRLLPRMEVIEENCSEEDKEDIPGDEENSQNDGTDNAQD